MRQPAKPKPQAFEEVARVLNVYEMLHEGVVSWAKRTSYSVPEDPSAILAVAERIAARTEG